MSRVLFEQIALFLTPFIVFGVWLVLRRQNPFTRAPWDGKSLWLALAGLAFVVVVMVISGVLQPRDAGPYTPPRMENGELKPGGFR